MTAAIEYPSRVNHQAWGMDFSGNHTFGLNLHPAFGEDHTVETSSNDHMVAFDLTLYSGVFAEHKAMLGYYVAFDLTVHPERAGHR